MMRSGTIWVLVLLLVSCKSAEFASQSPKRPATKPEVVGPLGNPAEPDTAGKPNISDPEDDGTIAVGGDDAEAPDTDTPIDTGTDTGEGSGPSLFDIIGGLIKVLKDVEIDQSDDGIEFGGRKKFRIGDGQAADSSCQAGLMVHPLSGTKFFFEFEVLEDNTTVNIDIESICGVDYDGTNSSYVEAGVGGQKYGEKLINRGASSHKLSAVTLPKGHFAVIVESKVNPERNNDADDFVVGKVRVRGDKPMKAGKVGAR